ncbi:MAG: NAD(+)/NADH kinase [Candidatus Acetothermia bacterium]
MTVSEEKISRDFNFLLYVGKDSEKVEEAKSTIAALVRENGIKLREVANRGDIEKTLERTGPETILLSLGGDGTFLRAADMIAPYRVPVLGINLGKLGFLAGLNSFELKEGLQDLLRGRFTVKELSRLKCRVNPDDGERKNREFTALNEVVIARGDTAGLAELELFLDSKKVATYPGDGLIVSTPTGSTAYSLSCGGPLITRNTAAFGITPLNVHKLGLRPIICSEDTSVSVKTNTPVVIEVDGKNVGSLDEGKTVEMAKSETPTLMIVPDDQSDFFQTVRNKLNWAKDRGTRFQASE